MQCAACGSLRSSARPAAICMGFRAIAGWHVGCSLKLAGGAHDSDDRRDDGSRNGDGDDRGGPGADRRRPGAGRRARVDAARDGRGARSSGRARARDADRARGGGRPEPDRRLTESVMDAVATALPVELPDHERRASRAEPWSTLLARLSRQSVVKHFDAYADVDWDRPDHAIDPSDPRWEEHADEPLGATAWYQALPQPTRARLGLHLIASQVKIGLEFERTLVIGLLEFASTLELAR